jgi:hypothetical protein
MEWDRPLERGKRCNVLSIQQDLPIRWKIKPGNQTQKGGFSAAGGAEESKKLVLANRDGNIIQRLRTVLARALKNLSYADCLNGSLADCQLSRSPSSCSRRLKFYPIGNFSACQWDQLDMLKLTTRHQ